MRSLLQGAGLGSEYWAYALRHAVYLKNRLPHSSLGKSPFEAMNGSQPDLSHLRVFGSKVTVQSGVRKSKLDNNNKKGLFMTFTGTDQNVCVVDTTTGREKTARHVIYDEAHMTARFDETPPYATALQRAGYRPYLDLPDNAVATNKENVVKYQILSKNAMPPARSTHGSAGLDLFSAQAVTIPPGKIVAVPIDIAFELDPSTYGQIQPRSGMALKEGIFAIPGVIDSDFRGNIQVLLLNTTIDPYHVELNQRVCQLITHSIPQTTLVKANRPLSTTERGTQGFGSTEYREKEIAPTDLPATNISSTSASTSSPHLIPPDDYLPSSERVSTATIGELLHPFNITLSPDPYDNILTRVISTSSDHPTRGLKLKMCPKRNLPIIVECEKGTPAAKISKWRSTLKGSYLLAINDIQVSSITDVENAFRTPLSSNVSLRVGHIDKIAMHPDEGIPMLYFDQLQMIAGHLYDLKHSTLSGDGQITDASNHNKTRYVVDVVHALLSNQNPMQYVKRALITSQDKPAKLTRKYLREQPEWQEWLSSEWKQLDQYEAQETFGTPCPLPFGANCLSLLWTYIIKQDESKTKKARCVCNGRPNNPGTVTWGYTYAKALDHVGHRIFWAAVAEKNFIVRGCDASNAFAEAPPPKHPLYVRIDRPFREWWESKGRPPIPSGYVLPVQKALQGHPEAPRLWATLIDRILTKDLGLKATTHENCLYHGYLEGKEIIFLRQVDDFLCASSSDTIAQAFIAKINSKMSIAVKDLGVVNRFNGVDIEQTRHYIRLHCSTYIDKIY